MQWPSLHSVDSDDERLILSSLRQGKWANGDCVAGFERQFAAFCGCAHALLVTNCTAALRLALLAVGAGPGDEVIIPGLIWPSVALAVIECGAEPVPVEIERKTYCISRDAIEASVTDKTRAIIVAHLFCSQADVETIIAFAKTRGLPVIEDAAHSAGARRNGRSLGSYGIAGCFSFNQKKVLACGEGGCLVTNDHDLFERVRKLRSVDPESGVQPFRMPETLMISEFQAASFAHSSRSCRNGSRLWRKMPELCKLRYV